MPRTSPTTTTTEVAVKETKEQAKARWAKHLQAAMKKWNDHDAWALVFEWMLKDEYGNVTVPACAQMAQRRCVGKLFRRAAALVKTPYDAVINWSGGKTVGKPFSFAGGLRFGEFKKAPALTILRCANNGRMFAVSTQRRPDDEKYTQGTRRFYSLCRLAQLLGGHTADWGKRLADLATLQFEGKHRVDASQGRRLTDSSNYDDVGDFRPGDAVLR